MVIIVNTISEYQYDADADGGAGGAGVREGGHLQAGQVEARRCQGAR